MLYKLFWVSNVIKLLFELSNINLYEVDTLACHKVVQFSCSVILIIGVYVYKEVDFSAGHAAILSLCLQIHGYMYQVDTHFYDTGDLNF